MEPVSFFAGVLGAGLWLLGMEFVNDAIERRLRIRAARQRVSRLASDDCAF